MKTRLISLLLVICMLITLIPAVFASDIHITQSEIQERLMELQDEFYEGRPWSNSYPYYYNNPRDYNVYWWNGGTYWWDGPVRGGYGCLAFAMELSDRVFGDLPARLIEDVSIDRIRVGDLITLENSQRDTHTVVVIEVQDDGVVIAEANFSKNNGPRSVHWGRKLSAEAVSNAYYMLTRYPEGPEEFNVSISGSDNGSVSISDKYAHSGDMVTITVAPDANYEVGAVELKGMDDLNIDAVGGTYSFRMPPRDVSITVVFTKIPATPFVDVPERMFYYEPVIWAVGREITTGTSATTFEPDMSCTRGQVVTFLWRAAGKPEPASENNPFVDVKSGDYYYKAVLWAVENGITNGKSETTFEPTSSCSRAEVVTFLWRAEHEPQPDSSSNPFTDVKSGTYYYKAVLWAVENGITTGKSKTSFAPVDICNRGQVVTFLYRNAAE